MHSNLRVFAVSRAKTPSAAQTSNYKVTPQGTR